MAAVVDYASVDSLSNALANHPDYARLNQEEEAAVTAYHTQVRQLSQAFDASVAALGPPQAANSAQGKQYHMLVANHKATRDAARDAITTDAISDLLDRRAMRDRARTARQQLLNAAGGPGLGGGAGGPAAAGPVHVAAAGGMPAGALIDAGPLPLGQPAAGIVQQHAGGQGQQQPAGPAPGGGAQAVVAPAAYPQMAGGAAQPPAAQANPEVVAVLDMAALVAAAAADVPQAGGDPAVIGRVGQQMIVHGGPAAPAPPAKVQRRALEASPGAGAARPGHPSLSRLLKHSVDVETAADSNPTAAYLLSIESRKRVATDPVAFNDMISEQQEALKEQSDTLWAAAQSADSDKARAEFAIAAGEIMRQHQALTDGKNDVTHLTSLLRSHKEAVKVIATAPTPHRELMVSLSHVVARYASNPAALTGLSQVPGFGHLASASAPPSTWQQQQQQPPSYATQAAQYAHPHASMAYSFPPQPSAAAAPGYAFPTGPQLGPQMGRNGQGPCYHCGGGHAWRACPAFHQMQHANPLRFGQLTAEYGARSKQQSTAGRMGVPAHAPAQPQRALALMPPGPPQAQ